MGQESRHHVLGLLPHGFHEAAITVSSGAGVSHEDLTGERCTFKLTYMVIGSSRVVELGILVSSWLISVACYVGLFLPHGRG